MREVVVGMLTHNGAERLSLVLRIVKDSLPPGAQLIVIENGSTDGTAALLESLQVEFIQTGENLTPGKAYNTLLGSLPPGIGFVRLDDDVILLPGCFDRLLAPMDGSVGVIGATLFSTDGAIQHAGGGVRIGQPGFEEWSVCSNKTTQASGPCHWVSGACMFVTAEALARVPAFDDRYAFWFEDIDYCFAVRESGLRVWHMAEARCYHLSDGDRLSEPRVLESHRSFLEKWRTTEPAWRLSRKSAQAQGEKSCRDC